MPARAVEHVLASAPRARRDTVAQDRRAVARYHRLMGKERIPKTTAPRRRTPDEDAALGISLSRVERFVDALSVRCELAGMRADGTTKGTRAAGRAQRALAQAQADLEAAQRLRDGVAAVAASVQAQVALAEAEAVAAISAAFVQFKKDRAWRRRRGTGHARSRKAPIEIRSPDELAELVVTAKKAIALVLADRNRLIRELVDTQSKAAELRGLPTTVGSENPLDAASVRRSIDDLAVRASELEEQSLASATAAQHLLLGLRKIPQRARRECGTMHRQQRESEHRSRLCPTPGFSSCPVRPLLRLLSIGPSTGNAPQLGLSSTSASGRLPGGTTGSYLAVSRTSTAVSMSSPPMAVTPAGMSTSISMSTPRQ